MNRHFLSIVAVVIAVAFMNACAKQGMPSGGPKDETPPKVMQCRPANNMLDFSGKEIFIEFDEYVVLKDAENNIIVSPPMSVKPEYRTKGRGVQISIKDTLKANTTYLFQFKDAIADFNEGNLLPSFEYVFSTGNYIDSMTVKGRILDALTQKQSEEVVSVWLFTEQDWQRLFASFSDTSVSAPTPTHVTRCDKQGNFSFNNIRPGKYFPLAIIDEDKNMKVGNTEQVAFVLNPVISFRSADTAVAQTDSIARTESVQMNLFAPQTAVQRITSGNFKSAGKIVVSTLLPMKNPSLDAGGEQMVWNLNASRDTITIWTLREKCDSLVLVVSDISGLQDTLKLRFRKKKGPVIPQQNMSIKLNYKSLPYFDTLAVVFSTPLDTTKCRLDSMLTVMSLADSTIRVASGMVDSTLMRVAVLLPSAFIQGAKYRIDIPKAAFHDIYNHPNDSINATVTVTKVEDYGNLHFSIDAQTADTVLIVQLLDEKGKVVQSHNAKAGEKVFFQHLTPAKYKVRAIVDADGNGEWTPGDLRRMLSPERVVYYKKTFDVRANWDFEETFVIK